MSTVKVQGNASGTGSITLASPNTNNNQVATLPDRTGNIAMDGPAFSAYKSGSQSLTASTWTKVTFTVEEYDTNSNYDAPNSRFQPTVAGYYRITGLADCFGTATGSNLCLLSVYKNAVEVKRGPSSNAQGSEQYAYVGATVYLNGSTDYVELYVYYSNGSSPSIAASSYYTYFQAELVRAA